MAAVKTAASGRSPSWAALDGEPRQAREVIQELVGGAPTRAQYNATNRAAHSLIDSGRLLGWREPVGSYRLLILRKVDRHVHDGDSGTFGEQEQVVNPLQLFTDAAWRAFGLDPAYGTEIALAASALAGAGISRRAHGAAPVITTSPSEVA